MIEKEFKWNLDKLFDINFLINNLSDRLNNKIEFNEAAEKEYQDRYYDTKQLVLYLSGFSCRVRTTDKICLEIKFQPKKTKNSFWQRNEWLIDKKAIKEKFVYRFEEKKVRDFFLEEFNYLIPGKLAPVLIIKSDRKKYEIKYKSILAELSFDKSAASLLIPFNSSKKKGNYHFNELELELLRGKDASDKDFIELGEIISEITGLENSLKNKLEKALTYFNLNLKKFPRFELNNNEMTSQAVKKIISYYLKTAEQNKYGVEIGLDSEYVHDMRVAIRKIRTALPIFRYTMTLDGFMYLRNNFKWIADSLGKVRDIDVFSDKIIDMIPSVIRERNADLLEIIEKEILKLHEENHIKMLNCLNSYRYKHFIYKLKDMLAHNFLRSDFQSIARLPIKTVMNENLMKFYRDVFKYSKRFFQNSGSMKDTAIHKLRIRFKRLRYSLEFFSSLLTDKTKKIAQFLPLIQDALGNYVDTFFIAELIAELADRIGKIDPARNSLFILNGISAAITGLKNNLKRQIFSELKKIMESRELMDFQEEISINVSSKNKVFGTADKNPLPYNFDIEKNK